MSSSRILQLNAFHAKVGGAEVYMHLLADALRDRGYTVGMFGGSPDESIDEPELRVVRREEFQPDRLIRDVELSEQLTTFCERFRPDLIHVHNIGQLPADFAGTIADQGVPVLQTVHEWGQLCPNAWCVLPDGRVCEGGPGSKCMQHGCESNYPFDGRVLSAAIVRYNLIPKSFDRFLCPSQALANDLIRHGYPNVEALPLWVDVEGFGLADGGVPEREDDHILFLGRLVKEKGVEYLVRAMPHVLERVPEARLSIVGGGAEEEALQELAKKHRLGESVIFHGKVPHDQVKGFFARASVNVLPSIWCENSPVTCYESYIAGLPMVASDIAGLPAMVVEGETGLLAKPRDPADLAEKIVRVLTDRELHDQLAAGCRRALEKYSRERHLTRIVEVYDELLSSPRFSRETPVPGPSTAATTDDALDVLQRTVAEYTKVERWAIDMKKHIDWIESRGGQPPSFLQKLGRKFLS